MIFSVRGVTGKNLPLNQGTLIFKREFSSTREYWQSHASRSGRHDDFAMAAGEMRPDEFTSFLDTVFAHLVAHSADGSIHDLCIDWRHLFEMLSAGKASYSQLFPTAQCLCLGEKSFRLSIRTNSEGSHSFSTDWENRRDKLRLPPGASRRSVVDRIKPVSHHKVHRPIPLGTLPQGRTKCCAQRVGSNIVRAKSLGRPRNPQPNGHCGPFDSVCVLRPLWAALLQLWRGIRRQAEVRPHKALLPRIGRL
jgi:hypothetical protein